MIRKFSNIALLAILILGFADSALAQEAHAAGSAGGLAAIGAGLAMGLAALGGALGQGRAAGSALDSIGRNPSSAGKLFLPMILGFVLIESLVILSFVIAYSIAGKV